MHQFIGLSGRPNYSGKPKTQNGPSDPDLRADQAEISDDDCADSEGPKPERPGEMIQCAGLGYRCRSKVGENVVG